MKKLALAIAAVLASGAALAQTSGTDLSDLSSTADAPNNLYDFIDNDMLSGVAYGGAELGLNVLLGDQEGDIDNWDMFKVGADFTYTYSESLALLMGGEARYAWGGVDELESTNYVDRFQFGIQTVAGKTTYGKQCGTVDAYAGFGDLGKEHGVGEFFEDIACEDELWDHRYTNDNVDLGVSYVGWADAFGIGGSYTLNNFILGGAYVNTDDIHKNGESSGMSGTAYSIGLVGNFDKLTAAVKYAASDYEHETDSSTEDKSSAYNLGVAYQFTTNLNVSSTYNVLDAEDKDTDDWFTVGASYRLNEHIELVTDYKVTSEDDDKLFLRANVNL